MAKVAKSCSSFVAIRGIEWNLVVQGAARAIVFEILAEQKSSRNEACGFEAPSDCVLR